ncbi:hypothetical protein LSCM1_02361 [Leishmania martiniquensis]|uniref:Uncharacterized protein n=1 Tax=Leishmania martiniquensis TaxID=1580590 RepID=A0A836KC89_9TRYP|nr:hypothetical protein LSCM1_02361 [Leishmania martiniquensis]
MEKAFPRLSLLVEEDPLPHLYASNGIAVLPSTTSHGSFVAVATHGKPSAAAAPGAFDVARYPTSSFSPIISLDVYSLDASSLRPTGTASSATAQAPEMMLVHTIPVFYDDVRCAHSPDTAQRGVVSKINGRSPSTAPATVPAKTTTSTETVGKGAPFFSPQSADMVPPTAPSSLEVQQIAWVGLTALAVKTRQRQLLLVRSGLTKAASSSSSEGEDDAPFAMREKLRGSHQELSAVCTSFARVEDFCVASVTDKSASGVAESWPVSVIIVAGLNCVRGVVCSDAAANRMPKVAPRQANPSPLWKEHKWTIGPFSHVAATPLADSDVCICATSLSGSVEVYSWRVCRDGGDAVPVCVHQVLMAPDHFFYGVSVSAAMASAHDTVRQTTRGISFWVVGGESTGTRGSRTARGGNGEAHASTLPALRGPDGCVLQVTPQKAAQSSGEHQRDTVSHEAARTVSGVPRILNSLWATSSNGSLPVADVITQNAVVSGAAGSAPWETARSAFEVASCLRLGAPCFLQAQRRGMSKNGDDSARAMPEGALASRYILLIYASANRASGTDGVSSSMSVLSSECSDNQTVGWGSVILSLDNADVAAALDWMAAAPSEAGVPPLFGMASVAPAHMAVGEHRDRSATPLQGTHELLLFTPHRILQLRVSHHRDSADGRISRPVLHVHGTYGVDGPKRIVGVVPLLSLKAPAPLLIFFGSASRVVASGNAGGENARSVYGQPTRTSTWAIVADVRASLLRQLTPWISLATVEAAPERSTNAHAHHREAKRLDTVQELIHAESVRLQRHFDGRMDRLEAMLHDLLQSLRKSQERLALSPP